MPNGIDPAKSAGESCPACQDKGNPINAGTGNKYQREADYGAASGLTFERHYNGVGGGTVRAGVNWTASYDRKVVREGSWAKVIRDNGKVVKFNLQAPGSLVWNPEDSAVNDRLTVIVNASNVQTGWKYVNARTEEVEHYQTKQYDALGSLTSITTRNGQTQTLTYSTASTPVAIAPASNLLLTVTDHYGRTLSFTYDNAKRIQTMTDPQSGVYTYEYDGPSGPAGANNLTKVTRPDGTVRIYHYNESANTSGTNLPNALTGITDETGNRYAIYQYDAQGRAVSTEHAGGVEKVTLAYDLNNAVTTVTDTLNVSRSSGFAKIFGVAKQTTVTGQPCATCGPPVMIYDTNGNVVSRTDWNGNKTCYGYDLTRNLETRRVEGLPSAASCATYLTGTPTLTAPARMVSTIWSSDWRLPVQVAEPLRITTYTYGSPNASNPGDRGNVLSRSVQATADTSGASAFSAAPSGSPRISSTTYNANGSVLTMDGPRSDVPDITSYTYYANNDSDTGKRGNVATVTNAAGHTTTITSYNAHGQPTGITDPNGLTTTLTYDSRRRLTARNVGGEITSYQYDGVGQLTQVTLPDGSSISYTYDGAHRLTGMADNQGNRVQYTLDLMGNRTQEQTYDPANQLAQKRSRVYNALNRLTQDIGANQQNPQTTQYAYDNQGNLTTVTGPLNRITSNSYDALNRLTAMTQPSPGAGFPNPVIAYGYNGQDQLTQVTDPRNLITSYAYDGLGNLNQQVSPDTGMTSNSYDAAGNILTSTDAKGQTTAYTYDALNRVTSLTYNQATGNQLKTVSYQYDQNNAQSTNGAGRLTTVTEMAADTAAHPSPLQTTQYSYDVKGRLTQETRTLAGNANPYTTTYTYNQSNGRMTGMTYPSGRTLAYGYDTVGRINQISTTHPANASVNPGATQLLATNISYHPFGGVKSYTLGNNQTVTRSYDQDGRISSYSLGGNVTSIGYDAASRIVGLLDTGNAANSNSYGYDNLDRLIQTVLPNTSHSYQYDLTGNRTSKGAGAATDAYSIQPNSNRIAQITGTTSRSFSYDPNGSTTNDGNNQYGYDARGRMVSAVSSYGTTAYQVNAMGQRVRKTNPSATIGDTVFHYDAQGKLIAETTPAGTLKKEYLYLLDLPIAVSVQ